MRTTLRQTWRRWAVNGGVATSLGLAASIVPSTFGTAIAEDRALVVGIQDYSAASRDLRPLRAPGRDARNIERMLVRQLGFAPENVVVLIDRDATYQNIVEQLETLARMAGPDDRVVIYYSAHGVQVLDRNGDEDKDHPGDRFDEALTTYDTDGDQRLIVDDELGKRIDSIRADHVLVILETCHSGSATRGIGDGRDAAAEAPGPQRRNRDDRSMAGDILGTGGRPRGEGRTRVVISACQADEQSYEVPVGREGGEAVYSGVLTWHLLQLAREWSGRPDRTSPRYSELSARLSQDIVESHRTRRFHLPSIQQPRVESSVGVGLDAPFAGATRLDRPYYHILDSQDGLATLDGGSFDGIRPGQRIELRSFGPDEGSGAASGHAFVAPVDEVWTDRCRIQLPPDVVLPRDAIARVRIARHDVAVRLDVRPADVRGNPGLAAALAKATQKLEQDLPQGLSETFHLVEDESRDYEVTLCVVEGSPAGGNLAAEVTIRDRSGKAWSTTAVELGSVPLRSAVIERVRTWVDRMVIGIEERRRWHELRPSDDSIAMKIELDPEHAGPVPQGAPIPFQVAANRDAHYFVVVLPDEGPAAPIVWPQDTDYPSIAGEFWFASDWLDLNVKPPLAPGHYELCVVTLAAEVDPVAAPNAAWLRTLPTSSWGIARIDFTIE